MGTWNHMLFDLDGTLTESGIGIKKGVQYALKAMGIEETDDDKLTLFIGPPLVDSFCTYYGMGREDAMKATEKYREYYNVTGVYENAPYDGVYEMLKALRDADRTLVIASSKPQNMVDVVLDHFDLRKYFSFTVCGADEGPLVTKAGVIAEALRRLGGTKQEAVMIGDRAVDIEGARTNGITAAGVAWGYAPKGELEGTDARLIAKTPAELTAWLLD